MKRVAVVGDLIIDRYIYFSSIKLSPEGPAPVVKRNFEEIVIGGAGNVCISLSNLGFEVDFYFPLSSNVTEDSFLIADKLHGINLLPMLTDAPKVPSQKTRYYVEGRQFMREDDENFDANLGQFDFAALVNAISLYDAVIISDYRKGCFSSRSLNTLFSFLNDLNIPFFVDTKSTEPDPLAGCYCLKINRAEYASLFGNTLAGQSYSTEALRSSMQNVLNSYGVRHLFVTLGDKGSAYASIDNRFLLCPSSIVEVVDITGAGDAYLASIVYSYFKSIDNSSDHYNSFYYGLSDLHFCNSASASVVACRGTIPISPNFLSNHQSPGCAQPACVGFTNGCFDLIHAGHIELLDYAKSLCDYLIVAINSDASVARLKGVKRPINSQEDRMKLLLALSSVDEVVVFDQDTPLESIKLIKPHVLIKGSDYSIEDIVGSDFVRSCGGTVHVFPFKNGYSTTNIIKRINERV